MPAFVIILFMNNIIGELFSLLTAFFLAENSEIYSELGHTIPSRATAHIRLWIVVLPVIICSLIIDGGSVFHTDSLTLLSLVASGIMGFFLTDLLLFRGFTDIGPRPTLVVMNLHPIIGAILAFFLFGENLSAVQIPGILLIISGMIIMTWAELDQDRSKVKKKGYLIVILAAVFQAVSITLIKFGNTSLPPFSSNMLRILGGLFCFIILSVSTGHFKSDFSYFKAKKERNLLIIAALTGPFIAMTLQVAALRLTSVGVTSAITQLGPLILAFYEMIFKKKKIPPLSLLGTFLAVFGVVMLFMAKI